MMEKSIIRIAVAVIADDSGRVLLVRKRNTDVFMQPGGKIEAGETARHSLFRELREELGTGVCRAEYRGRLSAPAANEPGHSVDADVFEVKLSSEPVIAAEIAEMCWYERHTSRQLAIAPLSLDILERLSNGEL